MKKQMLLDITEPSDDAASPVLSGKDEMNFAEAPIALLTDRVPKGQKFIKIEDEAYDPKRKRMVPQFRLIEGSEEYGLPTATDDLVILALIQLTKLRGGFKKREVEFTRLELLKMLGWADEGKNYDRLKLSLLRIKMVNYVYDNAWWDSRLKTWTTKAFSIIDNVEINDSRTGQGGLFPSRILWNTVVFDSFQAGFLRDIDFQLCMRLEHPTALRMYRFLGKRFYQKPDLVFDLKEFSVKNMGLGGNYEGGSALARKLKPAIAELESVGFLEPLAEQERFLKKGREWSIRFIKKASALPKPEVPPQESKPEPSGLVAALESRGITSKTAADLVQKHSADLAERQIEVFDWLAEKQDKRVAKNPAGYLVKSITDDYATPQGFITKAEQKERQQAKQAGERETAEKKRREREEEAREKAARTMVAARLKELTAKELAEMDAASLAQADAETLELETGPFRETGQKLRREAYIRRQLEAEGKLPPSQA